MIGRTLIREPYAPWSARMSLFALLLISAGALLHRISVLTTPAAVNLMGAGFILAALGFAVGLYAATSIWVRGRAGAWSCASGILIAVALWLIPAAMAPAYLSLPKISDLSTDLVTPPAFTSFQGSHRGQDGNPVAYPGARAAALQARAYPDLTTLVIPRPAEEVFELTVDLIAGRRGLGWKLVADEAPQGRRPGTIQATDRTLVLGFIDDIAIRITGTDAQARLDIRSASRYGTHDFGTNAARIRRFVRELSTRLDAAGPVGVASRGGVRVNTVETPAVAGRRPRSSATKPR